MKLTPVLTEKSLKEAKKGFYTFLVEKGFTKGQIKTYVAKVFGVHVTGIKTMNYKKSLKRNFRGQIQKVKAFKKAMVTLKDKEKIDLFEEKTK